MCVCVCVCVCNKNFFFFFFAVKDIPGEIGIRSVKKNFFLP